MESCSARYYGPMHCKAKSEAVIALAVMDRAAYQMLSWC